MDFYVGVGWACCPSPVLLFESKPIRSLLYESLTMSIVRQHNEIAFLMVSSPQETSSRADISLILELKKSALMRRTVAQTELSPKCMEFNEMLHEPRYDM